MRGQRIHMFCAALLCIVAFAAVGKGDIITAPFGGCVEYDSNDTPLAITDLATIYSSINVPDSFVIESVVVELNINHTFDDDLDVYLIHDEVEVELFTDVGGSNNNFTATILDDEAERGISEGSAPFTGTFRPEGFLSDFVGLNAEGPWELKVTDDAGRDIGALLSWKLTLCGNVLRPADGSENIPVDTCLSWQPIGVVSAGATVTWDVYLGTDPNAMTLVAADLTQSTYCPNGLQAWSQYFWQVIENSGTTDAAGPVYSFSTVRQVDLNHDGIVDAEDLYLFLDEWIISLTTPSVE